MARSRRLTQAEWRWEHGPAYDLRQYQHGKPTGLVAIVGWHQATGTPHATGPDVRLARDRSWLLIEEHSRSRSGARLRLPIRSCTDARLDEEPGLPGAALIRLTLSARIGRGGTFTVPLWFSAECKRFLRELVDEIAKRPPAAPTRAPAHPDWVVFRTTGDADRG